MTDQLEFDWSGNPAPKPVALEVLPEALQPPAPPVSAPVNYQAHPERILLEQELLANSGKRFTLHITNHVSSLMSLRPGRNGEIPKLKLHHMFLRASPEVRMALAEWLRHPRSREAGVVINKFIRQHMHLIEAKVRTEASIQTRGTYHDLAALYAELNQTEFNGQVDAPITWGRMISFTRRRSIQFGSYMPGQHIIRIHPQLDQEFVPDYFVRYIVFHEMLHAHMGVRDNGEGRRSIHPPEFRRREKAYGDYARATAWIGDRAHFKQLLLPMRNPDWLARLIEAFPRRGRKKS